MLKYTDFAQQPHSTNIDTTSLSVSDALHVHKQFPSAAFSGIYNPPSSNSPQRIIWHSEWFSREARDNFPSVSKR